MVPTERDEVARLMAQMAAGDPAAVFAFVAAFGGRLAGLVRRQLFSLGRRDVASCRDDVDFLVQSAAFALFDRAPGWSPDGALPWVWAERAIRAEVVAYLGHPSVELDPERSPVEATSPNARARSAHPSGRGPGDFDELARRDPTVGLLHEAIAEVANERDRRVHVEYGIQKRSGDASPAHTVAAEFGLSPENVRQIDRRVRRRLQALVATDDRFAGLRTLRWLAA